MADMDLDDLDGPIQVPTRTSRFAPKNSKLKSKSEPQEFGSGPGKSEHESSATRDDAVKMDVETKSEGREANKDDPMEEDDDGGDRVVREIDVFFIPQIDPTTQLYVFQYPLVQCWRPYELDERCEEVRVKPMSVEVEIDLNPKNYNVYDEDPDAIAIIPKQTLSSLMTSTGSPGYVRYAVGVLIGNKLHINPIHEVVQLRTSMEHLKSDDKSAGPSKKQSKLPGILNEHNNNRGEGWIPLKYHSSKSDLSISYLGKMAVRESSPLQFSMSPNDYVSSLCTGAFNENIKPEGPPTRFLHSLPLEERYKTWLHEGPVAKRFDTLKNLAPDDSTEDVLGVLQKCAHLVQGLWVLKTALLLEGNRGVAALARDYSLLLFSKNPIITYEKVNEAGPLSEAMKSVLNILATDRPSSRDWEFKEPPDTKFMELHPDIVKEQEQGWERVEKRLTEVRRGPVGLRKSSDMANRPGTLNPSKAATKSSTEAVSRTPMSNETREALPKALQKLFQTHKVCSFQQICQRLREMAVSQSNRPKGVPREAIAAAKGADAPQEELLEIISQVATNIHGVYVSKSSADNPHYDPLRKIVIDLFIAEGPNAKLKKASIIEAAKLQLKREIAPNEYQKVLNELCISQGSAWVLKRGDGNPE